MELLTLNIGPSEFNLCTVAHSYWCGKSFHGHVGRIQFLCGVYCHWVIGLISALLLLVAVCWMWHRNCWMLASCFSICRWSSLGLCWEAPWPCCGIGQKLWLLSDQSQTQRVCGCVFRCHRRRQALLWPVCVLYLYTWHFHFSLLSLPLILIFVTHKPQSQCVCVYVPPRTLGFPSGVYVWVQLTFCAYIPHPRSRGSHFSTSYQLGSTSRKNIHYSIMTFCSRFTIYWVWNMKKKPYILKSVILVMWESA